MAGAVVTVIVLVIALPVAIIISGGILAAIIGTVLKMNADKVHEGSELLATNK